MTSCPSCPHWKPVRKEHMKVYIASPYTKGDVAVNVREQIKVADGLMDLGHNPYVPLLSHFRHLLFPRPYEDWTKNDLEWVKVCDCLIRLEGESSGADAEVAYAKKLGIPVYYGVKEFVKASTI